MTAPLRWDDGRQVVEQFLAKGDLQTVTASRDTARRMLSAAGAHLTSATALATSDPDGAYVLLYDAARKALAALLEVQGLRATSRGGHWTVQRTCEAQFHRPPLGGIIRPFGRMRSQRNETEYAASAADKDLVDEDLPKARAIVEMAESLLEVLPVFTPQ